MSDRPMEEIRVTGTAPGGIGTGGGGGGFFNPSTVGSILGGIYGGSAGYGVGGAIGGGLGELYDRFFPDREDDEISVEDLINALIENRGDTLDDTIADVIDSNNQDSPEGGFTDVNGNYHPRPSSGDVSPTSTDNALEEVVVTGTDLSGGAPPAGPTIDNWSDLNFSGGTPDLAFDNIFNDNGETAPDEEVVVTGQYPDSFDETLYQEGWNGGTGPQAPIQPQAPVWTPQVPDIDSDDYEDVVDDFEDEDKWDDTYDTYDPTIPGDAPYIPGGGGLGGGIPGGLDTYYDTPPAIIDDPSPPTDPGDWRQDMGTGMGQGTPGLPFNARPDAMRFDQQHSDNLASILRGEGGTGYQLPVATRPAPVPTPSVPAPTPTKNIWDGLDPPTDSPIPSRGSDTGRPSDIFKAPPPRPIVGDDDPWVKQRAIDDTGVPYTGPLTGGANAIYPDGTPYLPPAGPDGLDIDVGVGSEGGGRGYGPSASQVPGALPTRENSVPAADALRGPSPYVPPSQRGEDWDPWLTGWEQAPGNRRSDLIAANQQANPYAVLPQQRGNNINALTAGGTGQITAADLMARMSAADAYAQPGGPTDG